MSRLRIDIWSDIACPWCYVGKRRFEKALSSFAHQTDVDVVWRAFELNPGAPREAGTELSYAERLAKKYSLSVRDAEAKIAHLTQVAQADGLEMRFDRVRPTNTFDAHRVLHLAGKHGLQNQLKERFLRAYMTEGAQLGNVSVLIALAAEVGLAEAQVTDLLESDLFSLEVRADEQRASELGISGVPCFVFAERYAVSGAQTPAVLARALQQAWEEQQAAPLASGAVCGPDGCA